MILPAHHCTGAVAGSTGMRGRRHLPRPSYSLLLHLDCKQTAIARATITKKNCLQCLDTKVVTPWSSIWSLFNYLYFPLSPTHAEEGETPSPLYNIYLRQQAGCEDIPRNIYIIAVFLIWAGDEGKQSDLSLRCVLQTASGIHRSLTDCMKYTNLQQKMLSCNEERLPLYTQKFCKTSLKRVIL